MMTEETLVASPYAPQPAAENDAAPMESETVSTVRFARPHLVVRVGVTGHRPKDLSEGEALEALRKVIRGVLREIQDVTSRIFEQHRLLYSGDRAKLRLVSPLAEGADRLVAHEALEMGFELQCPFPFHREEYEKDFKTAESLDEFEELRQQASVIFELDGSRASQEEAYEAVGRVVIKQSDVLIAIWNGKPAAGRGGTGQMVAEALARGVPTVRIKPHTPHRAYLCRLRSVPRDLRRRRANLSERLQDILEPPMDSEDQIAALHEEKIPQGSPLFRRFRDFFARGYERPSVPRSSFEAIEKPAAAKAWKAVSGPNASVGKQIQEGYHHRFEQADSLANAFADLYRSSFITTYAFGAAAVLFAFLGIYLELHSWFWVELVLIVSILLLLWAAGPHNRWRHFSTLTEALDFLAPVRRGRWHVRWLDYRLLAEALRQMDFLAPLARVTPSFEVPAHLDQDDPSRTWFNWYFRAVIREQGLIRARVDNAYLAVYRRVLAGSILSQIVYHGENAAKLGKAHHRLHRAVVWFFRGTLVACILHLVSEHLLAEHLVQPLYLSIELTLSLFAIVLPAFGAAVEGVIHQGEFERIARRSKAMAGRLETILKRVTHLSAKASSRELGEIAEYFCEVQLREQADWRSVFITKPLTPP